ncbi:GspH/FimT family pseudopilin [Bradyrhizobium brasilense]|uniref:Type II secretion system protein H n=1 Tax=Bradyrhizobium brasilense TaxID=1419277 RepID=A0ABY8JQT4_9BRAD|nr:GspH/FimT family pseudopilin [Bradyrhizobium brasilense]WFU66690.1 GspH/FimT family pseudopilin [Bradyrhizobium brasilense]
MTSSAVDHATSSQSNEQAGFALLEALCVLTILMLVMGLAVPALLRQPDGPRLEAAARQLAGSLRLARADAIAASTETFVAIDADRRLVSATSRAPTGLPGDIDLHLSVARQERRGSSSAGIRFFPDGTSSGGDVTLSLNGREARVTVNWLNGEARLDLASRRPETPRSEIRP